MTDTPQRGCRSPIFTITSSYRQIPIPKLKKEKQVFVIVFVIVEKPSFSSTDTYAKKRENIFLRRVQEESPSSSEQQDGEDKYLLLYKQNVGIFFVSL